MKAPDKIYRRIEGKFIRYYSYKPAKTRYDEPNPDEYIRKDALLEWARKERDKWLNAFAREEMGMEAREVGTAYEELIRKIKEL